MLTRTANMRDSPMLESEDDREKDQQKENLIERLLQYLSHREGI